MGIYKFHTNAETLIGYNRRYEFLTNQDLKDTMKCCSATMHRAVKRKMQGRGGHMTLSEIHSAIDHGLAS